MFLAALLALSGCDDTIFPPVTGGGGSGGETGYCGVKAIIASDCVFCHSAAGASSAGDLDLETDPHAALVGIASSRSPGRTLVVEGDPDSSLLLAKVSGTQDPTTEGGVMPPGTGPLGDADIEVIRAWITDGASAVCDSEDTGTGTYHPEGWAEPTAHGMEAKLGEQVCTSCHGEDLTGGSALVSCDTCHAATSEDWRTDCTFCHGGEDGDTSGAPPEGIRNETDASLLAFPPHATHVQATELKAALDCVQCHVKPDNVLFAGHVLAGDTTPGVADVTFTAGLSAAASWNGTNGTCSNLYCHGDGQGDNGTMVATDSVACGDCHAVTEDDRDPRLDDMSGRHEEHVDEGVLCAECHGEVVNNDLEMPHPEAHVNGTVDVLLISSMTRSGNTCTGTCHGELHTSRRWEE